MGWIEFEVLGLFCPSFSDELVRGKTFEGLESAGVQPVSHLGSFFVDGEHGVSAAGADDDCCMRRVLRRQIRRERRLVEWSLPGCTQSAARP